MRSRKLPRQKAPIMSVMEQDYHTNLGMRMAGEPRHQSLPRQRCQHGQYSPDRYVTQESKFAVDTAQAHSHTTTRAVLEPSSHFVETCATGDGLLYWNRTEVHQSLVVFSCLVGHPCFPVRPPIHRSTCCNLEQRPAALP